MRQNLLAASLLTAASLSWGQAGAATLTRLSDLSGSSGNIAVDPAGNIYGASWAGQNKYPGTVWELSPPAAGQTAWTETTLWTLASERSGLGPQGGIIRDQQGNLYGTALTGKGDSQCGTVFQLHKGAALKWAHRILWTFKGGTIDGCNPDAALVMDSSGALYGTTLGGGSSVYNGTVFKLSPPVAGSTQWTESLLWSFNGNSNGGSPATRMVFDAAGNLYGATYGGGAGQAGTVWELMPPAAGQTAWSFQLLWSFSQTECFGPTRGPLVMDQSGALYGTCGKGGSKFLGVVFKLAPPEAGGTAWTESTLWDFTGKGGQWPTSGVSFVPGGALIGATRDAKYGTVFELLPPAAGQTEWRERVLFHFDGTDGADPQSPLLSLGDGAILGTTQGNRWGAGAVWELTP